MQIILSIIWVTFCFNIIDSITTFNTVLTSQTAITHWYHKV